MEKNFKVWIRISTLSYFKKVFKGDYNMKEDEVFSQESVRKEILNQVKEIGTFLIEKNRKYGNSAIQPTRIFSKASDEEQIMVRLDDKLSRLQSGQCDDDEDVILDIIGYLIILRTMRVLKNNSKHANEETIITAE